MERDFKTLGIVLGKRNVKDNDVILSLLTPDRGILSVYVYGVRKSARAVRASLFTEGNFSLNKRSENGKVTLVDIDPLSFHEGVSQSLERMGWANLFSEMVLSGKSSDAAIYSLYTGALDGLESEDEDKAAIYFISRFMRFSGLYGDWRSCPVCQKKYGEDEVLGFSLEAGNAVCHECDGMNGTLILPPSARRYVARVSESSMEEAMSFIISKDMVHRISRYLLRTLRYSFPVHLNSLDSGLIM